MPDFHNKSLKFEKIKTYSILIINSWLGAGYYRGGHRSIGILVLTWVLVSFVFVNIYSSCLTSYMSLTSKRPDINSFKDLANDPNYQLTVLKGAIPEHIFLVMIEEKHI